MRGPLRRHRRTMSAPAAWSALGQTSTTAIGAPRWLAISEAPGLTQSTVSRYDGNSTRKDFLTNKVLQFWSPPATTSELFQATTGLHRKKCGLSRSGRQVNGLRLSQGRPYATGPHPISPIWAISTMNLSSCIFPDMDEAAIGIFSGWSDKLLLEGCVGGGR